MNLGKGVTCCQGKREGATGEHRDSCSGRRISFEREPKLANGFDEDEYDVPKLPIPHPPGPES